MTRLAAATLAALAIVATVSVPASSAPAPDARLQACAEEDSTGCVWDARHAGNGEGQSFIVTPAGKLFPVPHYVAHALVFGGK